MLLDVIAAALALRKRAMSFIGTDGTAMHANFLPAGWLVVGCFSAATLLLGCSRSDRDGDLSMPAQASAPVSQDAAMVGPAQNQSELNLRGKDIAELPGDPLALQHVRILRIGGNERLLALPTYMSDLVELEELNIDNGNGYVMSLRLSEANLLPGNLKRLNLSGALDNASSLPISHLQKLEELDLSHFTRAKIPMEVFSLKKLKSLRLDYTGLREVSGRIGELSELEALYLNCNEIDVETWPDLTRSTNLRLVQLGNNRLNKAQQELIRRRLPPSTKIDFENLWDDARANEE